MEEVRARDVAVKGWVVDTKGTGCRQWRQGAISTMFSLQCSFFFLCCYCF